MRSCLGVQDNPHSSKIPVLSPSARKESKPFCFGFVSQVDTSEAYIHLVAVDPPAQRQGIAYQLYEKFFDAVSHLGVRKVRLIVNPENHGSLAFHKKLGFQADLRGDTIQVEGVLAVKDYNGPGLHMIPFYRLLA
jgi:ribosomal protein S18 acetylase RimI-like enzyme